MIAYDDAGGALAARLWWMLRYMQHDAVADHGAEPDLGMGDKGGEEQCEKCYAKTHFRNGGLAPLGN